MTFRWRGSSSPFDRKRKAGATAPRFGRHLAGYRSSTTRPSRRAGGCSEEANAPNRELLLTGENSEIDLGALRLSPYKPTVQGRIERAKAAGAGDYTMHYGEKPPQWHILGVRGVSKDAQISDFKGKWLLVYFWGLPCYPCISRGILLSRATKRYSQRNLRSDD